MKNVKIVLSDSMTRDGSPIARRFYLMLMQRLLELGVPYDLVPVSWKQRARTRIAAVLPLRLVQVIMGSRRRRGNRGMKPATTVTVTFHTNTPQPGVVHVKGAYFPDYYYLDRMGYSGWSEMANRRFPFDEVPQAEADRAFHELQSRFVAGNISKYEQKAIDGADPLPERFVFLACQIEGDTVESLADIRTYQLIAACAKAIPQSGMDLVIKRHPKCRSERVANLLSEVAGLSRVTVVDGAIHALIERSSAVVVVNSGVGFEALLHEKPVVTFGHSDYHWVTVRMRTAQELARLPSVIASFGEEDRMRIRRFTAYFVNEYLVELGNTASLDKALRRVGVVD